ICAVAAVYSELSFSDLELTFSLHRHDVIAQMYYAKRLAEKLQPVARMIDLHGGHLVSHERPEEVNQALLDLIRTSETKTSPYEWTNLGKNISEWMESNILIRRTPADGERNAYAKKKGMLERLESFPVVPFSGYLCWHSTAYGKQQEE
ncbi:hypothetical protein CRG98_015437, partial [Punica granatum]